jgi:hypothetical protein
MGTGKEEREGVNSIESELASKRPWPRNCHVQQKSCVARTSRHERAAGGPGAEEEEPRQHARAAFDGDVGGGVGERERRVQRRGQRKEVEDEEIGEEDGPGQQRVRRRVHRVPVLRPEEGELRLEVQHPTPTGHRRLGFHHDWARPRNLGPEDQRLLMAGGRMDFLLLYRLN